ncbi:MAG TPA: carbohydrate kinase family protein [Acidobacteriota bacterium]|nr:carbohydrate kinase family protein [Acidobacteriota bacterium]
MVLVSGIAVVDLIASGLERPARPGELAFCSIRTSLGGHACNVSADLVRLGFPKSRLRAVFPAGRDLFGDYLVRGLREQGVRVEPVFTDKASTSLDLILVARGEDRRYHADAGANVEMSAAPVLALLERHRPLLYYAGGVGLLGRFDSDLARVLRRAKSRGTRTFVDVVSPYRKDWSFLLTALPSTDLFHCNADEAAALSGERDPAAAARVLRRLGAANVFVTLGGEGTVAAVGGSLLRVPAFSVRVVDPTGAGDAFSAGLIKRVTGLIGRGRGPAGLGPEAWTEALLYASACGAVCTTGIGTTTAVEETKVEALIRRQAKGLARAVAVEKAD